MSAVYNKQWFFVSFPCLSYILTYLPTTYLLEDIYVFNVVTYSVITSALAFSYLVTCNNLCKKFYQNDNVTCQFYQNTWIILVEIYTFVELFVNRMPFFIILSHFEITFSKLKSVQVMVRLHIFSDIFISGKNVVISAERWQHFCQKWKYWKNMQADHNLNRL